MAKATPDPVSTIANATDVNTPTPDPIGDPGLVGGPGLPVRPITVGVLDFDARPFQGEAAIIMNKVSAHIQYVKANKARVPNADAYLNELESLWGNIRSASIVLADFVVNHEVPASRV